MAVEFAEKLQLTAQALGCATQKELCARFIELNPATHFTLQNSYKWIKGRSLPRSGGVYRDWAQLLDLDRSAQFLVNCPLDIFSSLLSARYGLDPAGFETQPGEGTNAGARSLLEGNYACYSLAWSKAARGQLIRGTLSISLDADDSMSAHYQEQVPGGALGYSGRVHRTSRTVSMMLEDAENEHMLFISCLLPLPPGTILTGLLAGSAYHDLEGRPTAVRMLCVRSMKPHEAVAQGNRYLDTSAVTINLDLEDLGYDLRAEQEIGAACRDFLSRRGADDRIEISLSESEALAMAFARLRGARR
jgi:hypothetical protein